MKQQKARARLICVVALTLMFFVSFTAARAGVVTPRVCVESNQQTGQQTGTVALTGNAAVGSSSINLSSTSLFLVGLVINPGGTNEERIPTTGAHPNNVQSQYSLFNVDGTQYTLTQAHTAGETVQWITDTVASFGYLNTTSNTVTIPKGSFNNFLLPGPLSYSKQPSEFLPDINDNVFTINISSASRLTWIIEGAQVTTSSTTARCGTITYQGRLTDASAAANGQYDLQFEVFDALTDGAPQSGSVTVENAQVTNGIFTVLLNFGSTFLSNDKARFLEIGVRAGSATGNDPFTLLSPRQPLTSTPYAIRSTTATSADNVTGLVSTSNGGTGLSSAPTAAGQYLRSNAAGAWSISPLATNDIPALDAAKLSTGVLPIARGGTGSNTQSFVDLSTDQNIGGNKTFSGAVNGTFSGNGSGLSNVPGTFQWQVVAGTSQQAQANTGYVVTNAGPVTITMPATPNVGDTVRVSGMGAGGWKIAQNAGQSIVGANLSLIGLNWTPRESVRDWGSVASSADGSKLVAVVDGGQVYTSTDSGVSWTARDSDRPWRAVASSADGDKLVAVPGFGGPIYTSTDSGVSWTPRISISAKSWVSVASSSDGSKLVATLSPGQIYTSTDSGVSWTPHGISQSWGDVASSADGSKLVALYPSGELYTSADAGNSWTPRESRRNWRSVASSADGNKLVAVVHGSQIYTSTDSGENWTPRDTNRDWTSVASSADGNILVATVSTGQIYISTDSGVNWTFCANSKSWGSMACSADGGKFIAAEFSGQIFTSNPLTSSTTTTPGPAGYLLGGKSTAIELQYIGNGQFLQLSHEGTIIGY